MFLIKMRANLGAPNRTSRIQNKLQEASKSTPKQPKTVPKRSQDHFRQQEASVFVLFLLFVSMCLIISRLGGVVADAKPGECPESGKRVFRRVGNGARRVGIFVNNSFRSGSRSSAAAPGPWSCPRDFGPSTLSQNTP